MYGSFCRELCKTASGTLYKLLLASCGNLNCNDSWSRLSPHIRSTSFDYNTVHPTRKLCRRTELAQDPQPLWVDSFLATLAVYSEWLPNAVRARAAVFHFYGWSSTWGSFSEASVISLARFEMQMVLWSGEYSFMPILISSVANLMIRLECHSSLQLLLRHPRQWCILWSRSFAAFCYIPHTDIDLAARHRRRTQTTANMTFPSSSLTSTAACAIVCDFIAWLSTLSTATCRASTSRSLVICPRHATLIVASFSSAFRSSAQPVERPATIRSPIERVAAVKCI